MQVSAIRTQLAQRNYVIREERSFYSRAHADLIVGLWAAEQLGIEGDEAIKAYAANILATGVIVPGGRGGFEKLAADLAGTSVSLEQLRARYGQAMLNSFVGAA
ncbi:ATPase inhibitor subunit zeta [Aureimonas glaciei]|uniref:Uncharacterized protein n=1 Tax=Aureimonas glaciei TaxID=1776957 RepID=A0A916XRP7_9HYPH|nr:ATPase inhibitor subunit zeta [Aureimonas glaciei]GGD02986.1 hypothetical protein GCM10011335_02140 [Aureimonas glaciei]